MGIAVGIRGRCPLLCLNFAWDKEAECVFILASRQSEPVLLPE